MRNTVVLKEKKEIHELVSEYIKLIKLLLVIPGSSYTCERCFSTLRRLETLLRSTVTQKRLNGLTIINIYKEDAKNLDFNKIINKFICKNSLRKSTFLIN